MIKKRKIKIIKLSKKSWSKDVALKYDVKKSTVKRWKVEIKNKGEGALEWGKRIQTKANIKKR
ncbi:hypothetical protein [Spiroplasma tabanidicola]|uniref:hypothetical protein n=1 Tax=Spiroplasma tabanidicola TaxID=324079 RepID=UPI0012DEAD02|nr:hypothetical protein [Spiroplasma tabanidicola]